METNTDITRMKHITSQEINDQVDATMQENDTTKTDSPAVSGRMQRLVRQNIMLILLMERLCSWWWWVCWKVIKAKWAQDHSTVAHINAVNARLTWCAKNIYNASGWHGVNTEINGEIKTVRFL